MGVQLEFASSGSSISYTTTYKERHGVMLNMYKREPVPTTRLDLRYVDP